MAANRTTAGFPCAEADGQAGGYFQRLATSHFKRRLSMVFKDAHVGRLCSRPCTPYRDRVGGEEAQSPGDWPEQRPAALSGTPVISICATRLLWFGDTWCRMYRAIKRSESELQSLTAVLGG